MEVTGPLLLPDLEGGQALEDQPALLWPPIDPALWSRAEPLQRKAGCRGQLRGPCRVRSSHRGSEVASPTVVLSPSGSFSHTPGMLSLPRNLSPGKLHLAQT